MVSLSPRAGARGPKSFGGTWGLMPGSPDTHFATETARAWARISKVLFPKFPFFIRAQRDQLPMERTQIRTARRLRQHVTPARVLKAVSYQSRLDSRPANNLCPSKGPAGINNQFFRCTVIRRVRTSILPYAARPFSLASRTEA